MKNDPNDIETLAALEHDCWSRCVKSMRDRMKKEILEHAGIGASAFDLPCMLKWAEQMNTSYNELSEEDKEKDRKQVRKKLKIYRK